MVKWFGPALVAAVCVLLEPQLTALARGREAVLPLVLFLLLSSLLHPKARRGLVVTLCYGVAFLALRDSLGLYEVRIPPSIDYEPVEAARTSGLLLVAALAAVAGIGETLDPGSVWARRCYFAAAGLYFTGLGAINYAWHASWQSVLLCTMGVMSFIGCVFARWVVAAEADDAQEAEISDEAAQQLTYAAHKRAIDEKEWRDPAQRAAGSGSAAATRR